MYYVLTRPDCVWCDKAKRLLEERGEAYTASSLTDNPFLFRLMMRANLRTVPQIWENAEHIGGYTELEEHLSPEQPTG